MKIKISVLFILFAIFSHAQEMGNAAKHVGAGVVIGGVGGYAAHKLFYGQRGWTWAGAVGSSLAAGLAKESYDVSQGNQWETDDVLFTTLGGALSGLALHFIYKNSRRRSGRSRNRGCLVAYIENTPMPTISESGSGDITSQLQAMHLLR